ncbi:MAG: DNA (cytosine-5-)-methyltransferase [Prevotellaceae bacterium]|nr:DNA (cytosine-5-)-methyltransferase [Prevotellaceae bacterium]
MAQFSFIDLFAGIGGFRLALQSVGGECIGFSEIAPDAIKTYCTNFKESEDYNFGDITKLKELPQHDFMTAGVPCQSWSIAGRNLGFDDDRGQLWNDTLFLLNKVRPKAFIFENVKGLADPRNKEALDYILERIKQAGYHAEKFLLNAYDYGVPQTRVRIYIIGFREKEYFDKFVLPESFPGRVRLGDVLDDTEQADNQFAIRMTNGIAEERKARWSLSCNEQGFNDYFLFNDLRNGETTIHSWDIAETTEKEKQICYLLLTNRRKRDYGELDGNPLSLIHFQALDSTIQKSDLEGLVKKKILKKVNYQFILHDMNQPLTPAENLVVSLNEENVLNVDKLKVNREIKKQKVNVVDTLASLSKNGVIRCIEVRYDFKNTKISTGLDGINRIILQSSRIYPTLVASDTNDFVATRECAGDTIESFRKSFMKEIYIPKNYRKITKSEACRIQGFPSDYKLPPTRPRWMKLIGNSVAVPVIKILANAVVNTGVFEGCVVEKKKTKCAQLNFFDLFDQYELEPITQNSMVHEDIVVEYRTKRNHRQLPIDLSKNLLICNVKKDNWEQYLDGSAKIYYTGKKFPTTVALNKLYYFMPYLSGKGIRDLYYIKIARLGYRKEGQEKEDKNDLRLVFEIERVGQLFDDYKKVKLEIWRTFTDTTMEIVNNLGNDK